MSGLNPLVPPEGFEEFAKKGARGFLDCPFPGCFFCIMKEPPHKQVVLIKEALQTIYKEDQDEDLQHMWAHGLSKTFDKTDSNNTSPLLKQWISWGLVDCLLKWILTSDRFAILWPLSQVLSRIALGRNPFFNLKHFCIFNFLF